MAAVEARELVVGPGTPGLAEKGALGVHDPHVGLRSAAVDGQPRRCRAAAGLIAALRRPCMNGDVTFGWWAPRSPSSVGAAPTRPSWWRACAVTRTGWSSTSSCCSTPTPTGWRRWAAWPGASCGAQGWRGNLVTTDDRRPGHRRRRLRHRAAAGGRAGGPSHRRDHSRRLRLHRARRRPGPGGLAKALRTVPVVLDIAEETADHAAPGAWLVDFTNPVGIVTQALVDEGHRAVGLCNVAIHVQRRHRPLPGRRSRHRRARARGAQPPDLGPLGHRRRGRPPARAARPVRLPSSSWRAAFPSGSAGSRCPALLLPALLLLPRRGAAEQSAPGYAPRAEVVAELEAELLAEYRDPNLVTKPAKLSWRGGAFYSEAAVRLDRLPPRRHRRHPGGRCAQRRRPPRPARRRRGRGSVHGRTATGPTRWPSGLSRRRWPGWSPTARRTSTWPSRPPGRGAGTAMIRALVANPLVGQYPQADELADALLAANREYLPRFFPDG